MNEVHLPCSLKVYERHSGAPKTFLLVALKDFLKNLRGPECVAVTLVVNHTLQCNAQQCVSSLPWTYPWVTTDVVNVGLSASSSESQQRYTQCPLSKWQARA